MTAMLMVQDETVSTPGPREGGPRRRRAFTITEKLQHLTAYEAACAAGDVLRPHQLLHRRIREISGQRTADNILDRLNAQMVQHRFN